MNKDIISTSSIGIPVDVVGEFSVVRETLERIGIINKNKKVIYPSCYLHLNNGRDYSVCHFKELFALQGKSSTFNESDEIRRSTITYLLQSWNLVRVKCPSDISRIMSKKIDVVKHSDKHMYKVVHKFKYKSNR